MIRCGRTDAHHCFLGHHLVTAMPSGALRGERYAVDLLGGPMDGRRIELPPAHPAPRRDPTPYLAIGVGAEDGRYHLDGANRRGDACLYVWRSGDAL